MLYVRRLKNTELIENNYCAITRKCEELLWTNNDTITCLG